MNRHCATAVALLACGVLLTGCLGYHAGAVGTLKYSTVAVPMFRNKSLQPGMEPQVTNAIIKRLQADGSVLVMAQETADVLVTGEITRYRRVQLRSEREDSGTPREYRVEIQARVEARDQRNGQVVIAPTTLTGRADTFIGSDLQSADRQALPLAADDIARQVVSLLVEQW